MEPLQSEIIQLQKDIAILTPAKTLAEKSKIVELQGRLDQIEPLVQLYQEIYTNLVVVGSSGQTADAATTRLESTLSLYQQIYINLINTREQIRLASLQNAQSVNQIEVALAPSKPIKPQPTTNGLMGGAIGLALVAGIIFLIEYLDDTLKAPEDVERTLGLPLIGYIADMSDKGNSEGTVYVATHPRSPASEAFRSLRTNLEFAAVDKPLRTILVTGAEAGDGKTTIAANLAAIFAQGGKRVMLLDCDLRRPRTHRFFGLQNRVGMTDIFRDSLSLSSATQQWTNSHSVSMSVITSGSLPPNPAELLGSQKMEQILKELTGLVDVVVIDSPPSVVADAQVLSAKVDGVLLVIQPGKTHKAAAKATLEQIDRAGARIIGVVYNRISRQSGYYYYGGYRYYSPYNSNNNKYLNHDDDSSPDEDETNTIKAGSPGQSILGKIFNRSKNKAKNPA
jgi:capsular exopolysaccharide synthesis family protein